VAAFGGVKLFFKMAAVAMVTKVQNDSKIQIFHVFCG
jgi:hypothetical protein